jgi:hypothetical protein
VQRLFTIPLSVMLLVTVLGAALFAQPPGAASARHTRHWVLGILHGLAQVGLAAGGTWAWGHLEFRDWEWPLPLVAAAVLYGPAAALVATQLTALYLLVASRFGVNVNELYAGQGIEHGKCFLRMHVARNGTLTIYPVAVDRVCRRWRVEPDAAPDTPWLRPEQSLAVRLIEPAVVLTAERVG